MFYDRFTELCEINHVSPSRAATEAGFNKGTVSLWKRHYDNGHDVRPEPDVVKKISQYFDVSESWLLGLDVEEHPSVVVDNMTPAKQQLLNSVSDMDESQILKLLGVIEAAKKMV